MAGTAMRLLWTAAVLMRSGVVAQPVTEPVMVDMTNASLTSIPTGKPSTLTRLILRHNAVAMSASDIQALREYPMISMLDLSYNRIQSLPAGAFANLTSLHTLNLRGNALQTLDKHIFNGLAELKSVDLGGNPWNCSCSFTSLIKQLNDSGISTGTEVICYASQKTVLDGNPFCLDQGITVRSRSSALPTPDPRNSSSQGFTADDGGTATESNSWKFLLGVVALTLSTSLLIVCAVKSPSWYKLLFNYHHQRLREDVEPSVFNTGRVSNFSVDTEQTETSAQEHEISLQSFEDEDGFIEDGYIVPENYNDPDAPCDT